MAENSLGPAKNDPTPQPAAPASSPFMPPQISLPKGGGAIRGIGEKFAANPVTGAGSLTFPIYVSPGRSGFGPKLNLAYDSGRGNSSFGFGWSLDLPAITRKTDKGLPRYADAQESDIFILSGAEDLIPVLVQSQQGTWTREVLPPRTVYGKQYAINKYRPRVEGLFASIERWVNASDPTDTFWRSISKENITTWYGKTKESRIFDPADPSRVFSWLICESYDDKGNLVAYRYKEENSQRIDLSQASESNRSDATRSAQRYIKDVFYGYRTPYFPDLTAAASVPLSFDPSEWCFQLVFDYGEHDQQTPVPQDTGQPWSARLDPFSTYRPTFEVRSYRLCRRVLMFHHFQGEANIGLNCLVRSTDLVHAQPAPPIDPTKPFYSHLLSATQTGYKRDGATAYFSKSLPPLEFEYSEAEIDETVREVNQESLKNLPAGLDGDNYRWADLDGEGLSGILSEQGGSWYYKPNLSPVNQQTVDGARLTLPQFAPVEVVRREPSLAALASGRQQLMDLSGDGQLDLVDFAGDTPGFFERTEDSDWNPFATFPSLPVLDWKNPNLKFIDLTGNGLPDLLISEDEAFWWHTGLAAAGFGPGQRVAQAVDEEKGPRLVFADGTESIFLADMSGDGLTDLVRIRLSEVCYWPNLGYGRFGPKVAMDRAPRFERLELFDGRRIRLADIDGSGTADIIYFAGEAIHLYFNQSGNGWSARRTLSHFPSVESLSSATAVDLLGSGTACLVWSSPLPGNVRRPMRYIDLMSAGKPHLLTRTANNLGAETRIQYAPSTKFYVADKLAGTPWVTRIPFPVHVVERLETYDYISRNRFVSRYRYHHGYFDGVEREFRGFGRVDQEDTEEFATLAASSDFPQPANEDPAFNVPPVLTKTWYHTGAFFGESVISRQMEQEYYREGDPSEGMGELSTAQLEAMLLDDTVFPTTVLFPDGTRQNYDLAGEEAREACRALRGSILRQEIYALDGTDRADRPYTVSERNYTIEVFQPQGPNRYGVFFTHARETIDFHYERKLFTVAGNTLVDPQAPPPPNVKISADPRVSHAVTLSVDPFGNVLQSVAIGYGRRYIDPSLTVADQSKQTTLLSTCTEHTYTNAVLGDDLYRIPLPAQTSTYELLQLQPDSAQTGVTNPFRFEELKSKVQASSDGAHDLAYENINPAGLNAGQPYRRLISRERTVYRPNDMGASVSDAKALLPSGALQSLALPGSSYKMAFTPGLISLVYQRAGVALLPAPQTVLGSAAGDGGGYVDLDGDGHWWVPSGQIFYLPAVDTPVAEKTQAMQHFFLPRRFEDPFSNPTSVDYDDPHDLVVVKTSDAILNTVNASIDYRVLQPVLLTDPNDNRSAVTFDLLGLVAGTAVMGKATENVGDSLNGFIADLKQAQIGAFYTASDPHTLAAALLGNATTRVVYDVQQFVETSSAVPNDPSQWKPVFTATLARETHVSDLAPGQQTKIQITFTYSDGYGREIQKKTQFEPGPVVEGGPTMGPRWVGSGWTIFNNKGRPVRQYEPFFSQLPVRGHQFEFGEQVGISSIRFYDPAGRVVATLHANHTYDKVVIDPWHQASWDTNDTVLQSDPATDPDVGDFFRLLPGTDYSPTWYAQRIGGALGAQEQDAAGKAAAHANTPTVAAFDALGRTFLTVLDNATAKYPSRVELDIQGNQRLLRDAVIQDGDVLGRVVAKYDYDMLQNQIHLQSMEAGERWMLNDASQKSLRSWDSRGHNFRTAYEGLRRPTQVFVRGTNPANSDPRTLAAEILCEKIVYGEGQANDQALNLRTRQFQHSDMAGIITFMGHNDVTGKDEAYDFKGNLLRSSRQFAQNYKQLPDWSAGSLADIFTGNTRYDALNRPVTAVTADRSIVNTTYDAGNFLKTVSVNLRGAATATSFLDNIDYNAKGQRVSVEYGNNSATAYIYDPLTFRMVHFTTMRSGFPSNQQVVQDLTYAYDPAGNITHIADNADIQNVVFFRNQRVEPSADYTYDAIYRLIQASGREQLGLGGGNPLPPAPTSYNDVPRAGLLQPGDGNAVGTYTEQYQYDAAGNFLQFIHHGSNPANPGWTRSYTYNEASMIEPGKTSNRLTQTVVSGNQPLIEAYTHDLHGNITSMLQLQAMAWDFNNRLNMTRRQAVNANDQDGNQHQGERTYYVYDAAGQRVRKVTESSAGVKKKERFYLGGFELYREYDSGGNTTLERQTLHAMDEKKRVAVVETKTVDTGAVPGSLPATMSRYQFDNHLGTSCLEMDEAGAVISYEEYYPYGSTSYQAGRTLAEVSVKRYRYTGKERDEESGFYYHGARYYAPWLAVWTSADNPVLVSRSLNLYRYVANNPVSYFDPTGNDKEVPEPVVKHFNTVVPAILRAVSERGLSMTSAYYLIKQQYGEQGPSAGVQQANGQYRLFNEQAPVKKNLDGTIKTEAGKPVVDLSSESIRDLGKEGIHIQGISQGEERTGQPGKVALTSPTFTYDTPQKSVEHHIDLLKSAWKIDVSTQPNFEDFAHRLFSSGYATEGKGTPKDRTDDYDTKLINMQPQVTGQLSAWLNSRIALQDKRIAELTEDIGRLKNEKQMLEIQIQTAPHLEGIGEGYNDLMRSPEDRLKMVTQRLEQQEQKLKNATWESAKLKEFRKEIFPTRARAAAAR